MSRYTQERKLLRWNATDHLKVLKMLAWVVNERERPGIDGLWRRVEHVCADVMQKVLGNEGITLRRLCDDTLAQQGAPITPAKLMQRADKAERYQELNEYCLQGAER